MYSVRKRIDGESFGWLIHEQAKLLGIPRSKLARAYGVTWLRMMQIELGEIHRLPSPDQLNALSKLLRVPVEDLMRAAGYDLEHQQSDVL